MHLGIVYVQDDKVSCLILRDVRNADIIDPTIAA